MTARTRPDAEQRRGFFTPEAYAALQERNRERMLRAAAVLGEKHLLHPANHVFREAPLTRQSILSSKSQITGCSPSQPQGTI